MNTTQITIRVPIETLKDLDFLCETWGNENYWPDSRNTNPKVMSRSKAICKAIDEISDNVRHADQDVRQTRYQEGGSE